MADSPASGDRIRNCFARESGIRDSGDGSACGGGHRRESLPGHSFEPVSEWEDSLSVEVPSEHGQRVHGHAFDGVSAAGEADASQNPEIAERIEEIRFYLEHFMADQARVAMDKLEALTSDARILDPLRAAFASASQPPEEPEPQIHEINADEIPDFDVAMEAQPEPELAAPELTAAHHQESHDESNEIHQSFHDEALPQSPQPQPAWPGPAPAPAMHAEEAGGLPGFVADLEASLGDSFLIAPRAPERSSGAPSASSWPTLSASERAEESETRDLEPETAGFQSTAQHDVAEMNEIHASAAASAQSSMHTSSQNSSAAAAPAMTFSGMSYGPTSLRPLGAEAQGSIGGVDLSEMFGELKQELEEERLAGDEDPDTHYSLGVAFREMGLLDEAIAEFQKVCTEIDRGKEFTQPVQTYTWLAQCFLDKGVPQAAIHWYEKALHIPGLNEEGRLAINYELGSACESARDKKAALRHFTDVYSANIDYRDVAERIQALKS